jgi:hypothetical protein
MANYKIEKVILHRKLFIPNVKSWSSETLYTGELVDKLGAKMELSVDGHFLVIGIGRHTELVPLVNVFSMTASKVETNSTSA